MKDNKAVLFLKKAKRFIKKSINMVLNPVKNYRSLVCGYLKNKGIYEKYDADTVFIIGVPEYGNKGDQAITAAQISFLSNILPNKKIVNITEKQCVENLMCLKKTTDKYGNLCTLMGGGNMGELYPSQEKIRLLAVKKLKNAKIVIFPQSIDYTDNSKSVRKAKRIYEYHKNLWIFTREEKSENIRRKLFNCNGGLVPDIVLSYIPDLPDTERNGILFCTRQDKEKNAQTEVLLEKLKEAAAESSDKITFTDTYNPEYAAPYEKQLDGLNEIWEEFKKSELVITDRLHGMIFSVITGTPCIALDNTTGKVGNLYRTWLSGSGIIYISGEEETEKAVEIIKSRNYTAPCVSVEKLRKDYSALEKAVL
ncbi:MAG: polysaccharide pyruvyl transferase family protein [Oscillospiraceae bacterium]|nr:polysaccharide pyruvyl transferase family protein [Oscillospiraceae bacterium]